MTKTAAYDLRNGLWLGTLGVAIFALTLPMTRLAVGTLLRQWLADTAHGGRRLRWFNRCMALVLVVTAAWMATI